MSDNTYTYGWEPGGLELLVRIKQEIKSYGGNINCAVEIEREWGIISSKLAGNKRIWTPSDEYYLMNNFSVIAIRDLSKTLNRSQDGIWNKYRKLINASRLKSEPQQL